MYNCFDHAWTTYRSHQAIEEDGTYVIFGQLAFIKHCKTNFRQSTSTQQGTWNGTRCGHYLILPGFLQLIHRSIWDEIHVWALSITKQSKSVCKAHYINQTLIKWLSLAMKTGSFTPWSASCTSGSIAVCRSTYTNLRHRVKGFLGWKDKTEKPLFHISGEMQVSTYFLLRIWEK